jgi:hypothetical protein
MSYVSLTTRRKEASVRMGDEAKTDNSLDCAFVRVLLADSYSVEHHVNRSPKPRLLRLFFTWQEPVAVLQTSENRHHEPITPAKVWTNMRFTAYRCGLVALSFLNIPRGTNTEAAFAKRLI